MEQADLLRHAIRSLESLNVAYMLVGSFASIAWGEPRFTQDIDIVLDLPETSVANFCSAFPPPEFYLNQESVFEAIRNRFQFNLLHPSSGSKIDFVVARSDEWGREQMRRRQRLLVLPGQEAFTAAPEDVIIGKLWYYSEGGSEKHLRDIAGMLRISGTVIDQANVGHWAERLGLAEVWQAVLARLNDPKTC